MSGQILGGDVTTQFAYTGAENLSAAMEACRLEQAAMCGYDLILTKSRQTKQVDAKGQEQFEVFVTFSPRIPNPPVPELPVAQHVPDKWNSQAAGKDATQA